MINRKTVIYLFIVAIASTTLYVVFKNLPFGMGSHIYVWAPIALLLVLLLKKDVFLKNPLKIIVAYGFVIGVLHKVLWIYMDDWNRDLIFNEYYIILFSVSILMYFYYKRDWTGLAKVSFYGFIFILITTIITFFALLNDPMIVRVSAGGYGLSPARKAVYETFGLGGYGYITGLVTLIPITVYYYKINKLNRIVRTRWLLILILLLSTIIAAQIFANILISFLILIFSFYGTKNIRKSYLYIFLISLLIVIIPAEIISSFFQGLSDFFPQESDVHYKLNDFSTFVVKPDFESTGAGTRSARFPLLFDAFVDSPWFGDASYKSPHTTLYEGGHLHWMNRLTLYGVFAFSFFAFLLYKIYSVTKSIFNKSFLFYYNLSVLSFILLGLIKAINGREGWLMLLLIVPGLYFLQLIPSRFLRLNS